MEAPKTKRGRWVHRASTEEWKPPECNICHAKIASRQRGEIVEMFFCHVRPGEPEYDGFLEELAPCPNAGRRWDGFRGTWIAQRTCKDCGSLVDEGDPCPYPHPSDEELAADSLAAEACVEAELAAMQEAEDRRAIWLCRNGREDEPVDGGMPAFLYKALYLDEP